MLPWSVRVAARRWRKRPSTVISGDRSRSTSVMPVRRSGSTPRESVALDARRDADAVPRHRRAADEAAAHRPDLAKCPRCKAAACADTHDMQRATRFEYSDLPERPRSAHQLLRLPAREELHPPADAAADRRAAEERRHGELLQLRRAGRLDARAPPAIALRIAAVHAGHEAGRGAGRAAAESRRSSASADRSVASDWSCARAARDGACRLRGWPIDEIWFKDVISTDLVGAGLTAVARWMRDA